MQSLLNKTKSEGWNFKLKDIKTKQHKNEDAIVMLLLQKKLS